MMMNFLMTSAPLAMELCGIEMHVIAMYAPSFFTGRLIAHFGGPALVMTGLALTALSAAAAMSGITVDHFWLSLVKHDHEGLQAANHLLDHTTEAQTASYIRRKKARRVKAEG